MARMVDAFEDLLRAASHYNAATADRRGVCGHKQQAGRLTASNVRLASVASFPKPVDGPFSLFLNLGAPVVPIMRALARRVAAFEGLSRDDSHYKLQMIGRSGGWCDCHNTKAGSSPGFLLFHC